MQETISYKRQCLFCEEGIKKKPSRIVLYQKIRFHIVGNRNY